MSDWNKQRGNDMSRRGGQDRGEDRAWRGEERWGEAGQRPEQQRSFGFNREEGYGASSGSRQGHQPDRQNERYGRGSEAPESGSGGSSDARYGREDFGQRQGLGAQQGYDSERVDRERRFEQGRGGQGGQFTGRNEPVQHVTDGDSDHGMWSLFGGDHGRGEHRGRGPKNYTRSDDRIRDDINDRLTHDSRVDATEIDVQVSQCEVTLTGTVNNREDKRIAEDIAEQISGVKHVQNNLRVQQRGAGLRADQSREL